MKQYAVVMAVTLILAWVVERTYVVAPGSLATKRKDRALVVLIYVILTFFVGLRTQYNDTYTYRQSYNRVISFPDFWEQFDTTIANHPGFQIFTVFLKTKGASEYTFLLICSGISLACAIWFLRKYSNHFVLTLFLFFTTNTYMISAAAIKQSIAIGIALIAVHFSLKRNWIIFAILIAIAFTFHPYVLFFLLVPFLTFKPWKKWTYLMLIVFVCAGFMLESLLGTIIDITTMIGESHVEEKFMGDGINIFRVLVSNVPTILTFVYRKTIFQNSTRIDHLMINLAMLNGAIMFVGMFGTAIYFSRMASYFTIAQCIALPWILKKLPHKDRALYKYSMICGYILFFIYANIISQSFDANFSRMSLAEFIRIAVK